METVCMILFILTAVILILLVLVQKGRGGGLAGAFGGPGGHSAFGTKTADIFVKATAVVAGLFFVLSILTAWIMRPGAGPQPDETPAAKAPAAPGGAATGKPGGETAKPQGDAAPAAGPAAGKTTPDK